MPEDRASANNPGLPLPTIGDALDNSLEVLGLLRAADAIIDDGTFGAPVEARSALIATVRVALEKVERLSDDLDKMNG